MNDQASGTYSNHCAVKGTGHNKIKKKHSKLPTCKQSPNCIHRKRRQITSYPKVPLAIS